MEGRRKILSRLHARSGDTTSSPGGTDSADTEAAVKVRSGSKSSSADHRGWRESLAVDVSLEIARDKLCFCECARKEREYGTMSPSGQPFLLVGRSAAQVRPEGAQRLKSRRE